jgi:hypothetical protein
MSIGIFSLNSTRLKLEEFPIASRNLMAVLQEPFRKPSDRKGALKCYEESQ